MFASLLEEQTFKYIITGENVLDILPALFLVLFFGRKAVINRSPF